ncbi:MULTISPECIES: hypothetical protein [Microbacterium]|uniref:hypothetical protein n=1 Tax=Microbacterium TaxID=33882 RepID=UPI0006921A44|nr:hypothetical protein [Microbacterium profundi]
MAPAYELTARRQEQDRAATEWILFGPFAIRLAPAASTSTHVARTTGQVVVFWGLFLTVFPVIIAVIERRWNLHVPFPDAVRWAGLVLFLAASALGIWSAVAMSTRGEGTRCRRRPRDGW